MSGWYSNLKSSVSNLQRTVFNSEADGDTDDDTHVCRVLRAYYIEQNQGFPQWLPPDPKAPPPVVIQQQQSTSPAPGSRYGNMQGGGGGAPQTGLSSLWDKNRGSGGGAASPAAAARNPFANRAPPSQDAQGAGGARPLPSQRAGSYQSSGAASVGSSGGGSIQDRLRGRLAGGARTVSPGSSNSGPFAPPPASSGGGGGSGDYDPYRAGGGYGGGGGGGGGGLPSGPRRMGGLPSGPRMR